jgi:hypothetical protein
MDQAKVERFWQAMLDQGNALNELLAAPPSVFKAHEAFELICEIEEMMRGAIHDIDPLLSADLELGNSNGDRVLMISITCHDNPAGIEAVQKLVAVAPAIPPCFQVRAFRPPMSREMMCEHGSLMVQGMEVQVEQVRFVALPSHDAPGTFEIACFVPPSSKTEVDPEKVPGAFAAYTVLSMGIGELRFMTRIQRIKVAVTQQVPDEAVFAWNLVELLDHAPTH